MTLGARGILRMVRGIHRGTPSVYASSPSSVEAFLREVFRRRFIDGYNGTKRSNALEIQVFLHPAFKSLRCLDSITNFESAANARALIREAVIQLAYKVAEARRKDDVMESDADDSLSEPQNKIRCTTSDK